MDYLTYVHGASHNETTSYDRQCVWIERSEASLASHESHDIRHIVLPIGRPDWNCPKNWSKISGLLSESFEPLIRK